MRIRAVNLGMASGRPACAGKMSAWDDIRMTLRAEVVRIPQEIIRVRPVHEMAGHASISARCHPHIMIVDERTLFVAVASETQLITLAVQL